jgi:hypothetical protein
MGLDIKVESKYPASGLWPSSGGADCRINYEIAAVHIVSLIALSVGDDKHFRIRQNIRADTS